MRPHFRTWDWALPPWVTGWIQFRSAGNWSVLWASFLVERGPCALLLSPAEFAVPALPCGVSAAWLKHIIPLASSAEISGRFCWPSWAYKACAKPLKTPCPAEQRRAYKGQMQQVQGQAMSAWQGSSTWWWPTLLMHGPIPSWGPPNPIVRAPGPWCGPGGGQCCPFCPLWPLGPAPQPPLKPAVPTEPDRDTVTVIMDGWLFSQSWSTCSAPQGPSAGPPCGAWPLVPSHVI